MTAAGLDVYRRVGLFVFTYGQVNIVGVFLRRDLTLLDGVLLGCTGRKSNDVHLRSFPR